MLTRPDKRQQTMTEDPQTIDRNEGFYKATNPMAENGVRRLPVCEGDELVGIITADDLTEPIADEEQQLAEVIRAQRGPSTDRLHQR